MTPRHTNWLALDICVFIWILKVTLGLAVICQDCPEPCHIPGVCTTTGRCFVRRDVNDIYYRGCADIGRWKDLDLSENGCSLQEYLGWNRTKALWCFCDRTMCNRRGILAFKRRKHSPSEVTHQNNTTERYVKPEESQQKLAVKKIMDRPSRIGRKYKYGSSRQTKNSQTPVNHYSGRVGILDQKTGLNENIMDASFRHEPITVRSTKDNSAEPDMNTTPVLNMNQRQLLNNLQAPVIDGHVAKLSTEYMAAGNQDQSVQEEGPNHVMSARVTDKFPTVDIVKHFMPKISTIVSESAKPDTYDYIGPMDSQTRQLAAVETTTHFMIYKMMDIVGGDRYVHSSKVDSTIGKHITADGNYMKDINLSSDRKQFETVNEKGVLNSKSGDTIINTYEQPQIWPEKYRNIAEAEKSGEYINFNLNLDKDVKLANLYSKDQVGIHEGNSVLDQTDHTDIAEQMDQIVDVTSMKSSHLKLKDSKTSSDVKDLLFGVMKKLSNSSDQSPRGKISITSPQRHIGRQIEGEGLIESRKTEDKNSVPRTTTGSAVVDRDIMESFKSIQLNLDISDFNVASANPVVSGMVRACGHMMEGRSHDFPDLCPPTYTYVPRLRSCYLFSPHPANYTDAETKCQQDHSSSHLVAIETLAEYDCLSEWLEQFSVLLDGWQGWWTGGIYNSSREAFQWSRDGHVIEQAADSWLSSLVVYPYHKTCVWFVPLSLFSLGNYWCEEESGFICEVTL